MKLGRRKARVFMMQAIFQLPFHEDGSQALDFILDRDMEEGSFQEVQEDFERFLAHKEEVDTIIHDTLIGWDMHRLAKVDLAILRLAVYEMYFCDGIPPKVSINEAVELGKKYSTDDSSRFINGILGSVYKKYEEGLKD